MILSLLYFERGHSITIHSVAQSMEVLYIFYPRCFSEELYCSWSANKTLSSYTIMNNLMLSFICRIHQSLYCVSRKSHTSKDKKENYFLIKKKNTLTSHGYFCKEGSGDFGQNFLLVITLKKNG